MKRPDGRTKPIADDDIPETQRTENGRGESWQADPSHGDVRNDRYTRDINKRSDRRTGLKTADDHASWRAVYHACNVGVGLE